MAAVASKRTEIVRFLIESGANVNPENRAGEKVLKLAMRKGNLEVIKLLRDAGATED